MKKLFTIALALVLTFALAACGCQAKDTMPTTIPTVPVTTAPTTVPATETTIPSTAAPMDPTADTNIPDPEVDDNSTEDMTEDTIGEEAPVEEMIQGRTRVR